VSRQPVKEKLSHILCIPWGGWHSSDAKITTLSYFSDNPTKLYAASFLLMSWLIVIGPMVRMHCSSANSAALEEDLLGSARASGTAIMSAIRYKRAQSSKHNKFVDHIPLRDCLPQPYANKIA
jgi:hypothetical protein